MAVKQAISAIINARNNGKATKKKLEYHDEQAKKAAEAAEAIRDARREKNKQAKIEIDAAHQRQIRLTQTHGAKTRKSANKTIEEKKTKEVKARADIKKASSGGKKNGNQGNGKSGGQRTTTKK